MGKSRKPERGNPSLLSTSMRFRFGKPPEDKTFDPIGEGCQPLHEPEPRILVILALPVATGLFLLWGVLCLFAFPVGLFVPGVVPISENVFQLQLPIIASILEAPVWLFLVILILFIPVHELIHASCFPDKGLTDQTIIGFWFSTGFFYAHYEGAMPRNRFLTVLIAPYITLSILPIILIAGLRFMGWPLETMLGFAWLSLLNSLGAAGDLIGFWLVISQIPKTATVRNKGWRTYWKR